MASKRGRCKTSPQTAQSIEDIANAFRLRREGYNYQAIADEMGCAVSTSYKRVKRAFKEAQKLRIKATNVAIDIDLERLDYYLVQLSDGIEKKKLPYIREGGRIVELRGKILGYSAAREINLNLDAAAARQRMDEALNRKVAALKAAAEKSQE